MVKLIKSLIIVGKTLLNRKNRAIIAQDGMERMLRDRGLNWLFQSQHTYLDFTQVIYMEEVVGHVDLDGDVHLNGFGLFTGATAKFIIETLKKSPDSIWRNR